ncbi:MAG: TIGR02679 family protein [Actinomycetota bacterium]|nr:TIGR02679 family protein [Actinomycetota bacterium]
MSTSDGVDVERLRRVLGTPDLAWLVDRVRARMERGVPLAGPVTLSNASPEQRRAVERLLGRRAGRGASVSVSLDDLDVMLRTSGIASGGLGEALRTLLGGVRDVVAEEARRRAAWAEAFAPVDDLAERRPELAPWRVWLVTTGMVRRLAPDPTDALDLLSRAVRVIDALPSPGIAIGSLAADRAGGAHGLDDGKPLATLVLAAARVLAGSSPAGSSTAAGRRAAWAGVGVHRDELSSTVLCLGIPAGGATVTGAILAMSRDTGEPCVLTLRQLLRHKPSLSVGERTVWICENPIVVATAADELGAACPPVVCLAGQPSLAAIELLTLLASDGAHFAYHGDFDWGGIRIANGLTTRVDWTPWRFDTESYEQAILAAVGDELRGQPATAHWDPRLRGAMESAGRKIEEELFLPDLIADLAAAEEPPVVKN